MYLVEIDRAFRKPTYTIGRLYCNKEFICNTLEDVDRDLNRNGIFDNGEHKVYSETAIPNGTYDIQFRYSPKFSPQYGNKPMPYIDNVSEFTGVLFHWGNTNKDTSGCILVGYNTVKGKVTDSKKAFAIVYDKLWRHKDELLLKIY